MKKDWSDEAWEDYLYWQKQDKKMLKKINDLLKDIERNGEMEGIGKPERLKDNLSGYCSRHIDEKNRLIYRVINNEIDILQCGSHYRDK